jgi:hypothetical protein
LHNASAKVPVIQYIAAAMVWVPKEEAALHLGVHVATIDRKLKRGELNGKRDPRPRGWRWLVELPEEPAPVEVSTSPPANPKNAPTHAYANAPTDAYANAHAKEPEALRELVDTVKDEVAQLRLQLQSQTETYARQVEMLQKELDHRAQEMERMQILLQQALDPARAIAPPRRAAWWQRLWRRD